MRRLRKETICILGLTTLGIFFFYKTIFFSFLNTDDPIHTSENIAVLTFDLRSLLFKHYIGLYHPLTTLSFAIDWWLGGSKPWVFHLNNFIFHLLSALILLKVSLRLWPKKYILGFLISFTFLLHPLKAESVGWITERKDLLSGLFLWLTIYLYLIYLEQKRFWQYILANISFLLALASKVSVVPLPIFLLVIDWYRGRKLDFRTLINKTPFFLLALTFGLLNLLEQSRIRAGMILPQKNYSDLFYQMQFYVEKALFPWNLRAWYSAENINFNIVGLTSIALLSLLAIINLRRSPYHKKDLIFGLSFFALFLFPNIKLLPRGDDNIVQDRYMYLALTGLTIAFFPFILSIIREFWINQKRFISLSLSGILVALLLQWLYIMHFQISYWKDPITLWRRASILEPNSSKISGNMARALLAQERNEEALPYLKKSSGEIEDYANLGYALNSLKRSQEAESIVLEGLKKYPFQSQLLNLLGTIKLGQGQNQAALSVFTYALENLKNEQSPRQRAIILNHIGLANMQLGRFEKGGSFFAQALALYNNDDKIMYNLGICLLNQNRLEEARNSFLLSLKFNPTRAETYNNMAVIFSREKNYVEARTWLQRALKIDPNSEQARNNLAVIDKIMR